ncbi:MAG: ABC transporter ATP-binding protein [Janthinobacterium lividum]
MLRLERISAGYGAIQALEGISLSVETGQIVCLLGANGAGKSTTLNCISAVVPPRAGSITFEGRNLVGLTPDQVVALGVVQVPEGREIFGQMSVADNIALGAWVHRRDRAQSRRDLERVYAIFPRLKERTAQMAGTLSGGEQQMLMIGRAMMARPKLLLLDEPSLGLSPRLVEELFEVLVQLNKDELPLLVVEQNAQLALAISQYGYILENGEMAFHDRSETLRSDPRVQSAYLGT